MVGEGAIAPKSAPSRVRFVDVLRVRTFAVLYLAETQSIIGDQLARVALSILVFERTGSSAATALTYAFTFLPSIAGGALLAGLGDRYSRVVVMATCDIARGVLFGAMAIPDLPLPVVMALLVTAVLLGPTFRSAELSVLARLLDAAHFRVANGLRLMTSQVGQVAGFAVGGVVVAVLHPRFALAVDAASYLLSSVIVLLCVSPSVRSWRGTDGADADGLVRSWRELLRRNPRLRRLFALMSLAGFFVVPEGLAAPYARSIGAGTVGTGLLLAAIPLGAIIGAWGIVQRAPGRIHDTVVAVLCVLTGLPLVLSALKPPLGLSILLWAVSGLFSAYQVDVITNIVRESPDPMRARTTGIAAACLAGVQGVGVVAFGAVAEVVDAATAIAMAGGVGAGVALGLTLAPRSRKPGRAAPDADPAVERSATAEP